MKKLTFTAALLILISFMAIFAQESGDTTLMRSGLDKFKSGQFGDALLDFREIILDTNMKDYHGSAYFWITKCYLAQSDLKQAGDNLGFFLKNFVGHPFMEEGFYQKGRIEFLKGEYEISISDFYSFITSYPDSDFIPNSYFWIGESLYNLGHYEESEKIFYHLVSQYPTSYKMEAANYRLALIDLVKREDVLMDLVKLSHEEYVTSLEEFQRKERTYEQAISAYQRRIVQLENRLKESDNDKNAALANLKAEMQTLLDEAVKAASTSSQPVQTSIIVDQPTQDLTGKQEILELKNSVLEVKGFLFDLMSEQLQGGM
ncbi:MAG: tetratricopeptide repeat protein [Spirochaetales bacterium]|nr:tetratricopeptide repeat protein [Spirochaetales bacterium]